jgi:hypothetical protein
VERTLLSAAFDLFQPRERIGKDREGQDFARRFGEGRFVSGRDFSRAVKLSKKSATRRRIFKSPKSVISTKADHREAMICEVERPAVCLAARGSGEKGFGKRTASAAR